MNCAGDHTLIDTQWKEMMTALRGRGTVPGETRIEIISEDGQIVDCGAWYGRFILFLQQHGYFAFACALISSIS